MTLNNVNTDEFLTLNIFYGNHLYLRISKWGVTLGQSSSELLQFKVEGLEIEYYENVNRFQFLLISSCHHLSLHCNISELFWPTEMLQPILEILE